MLLCGRGLTLSFGPTPVLCGVDFEISPGEIVAVMGPSGSGKSTLLHCLAGLLRPGSGSVHLEGRRIDQLGERARSDLRLRRMGFVFQFGHLIPELSLIDDVELPLRLTGTGGRRPGGVPATCWSGWRSARWRTAGSGGVRPRRAGSDHRHHLGPRCVVEHRPQPPRLLKAGHSVGVRTRQVRGKLGTALPLPTA